MDRTPVSENWGSDEGSDKEVAGSNEGGGLDEVAGSNEGRGLNEEVVKFPQG